MSLKLKYIHSWKLEGTPTRHNIFNNIRRWKTVIEEQSTQDLKEDELNIFCIQGLYGYNSGFIGNLLNFLSYGLSTFSTPVIVSYLLNLCYETNSNDYELITFLLSIITRIIPINNFVNFDPKNYTKVFEYTNENKSFPNNCNLSSLFLLQPIFDSGCAIYSNRKPVNSGFEPWGHVPNKYKNKGMTWCYFRDENKNSGISVINIDLEDSNPLHTMSNLKQLTELKHSLENHYSYNVEKYETYIVGSFDILLNFRMFAPETQAKYKILSDAGIQILNETASDDQFIMYSSFDAKNNKHIDLSVYMEQDENMLYKFNIVETTDLSIDEHIEMEISVEKVEPVIESVTPNILVNEEYFADNKSEEWEDVC